MAGATEVWRYYTTRTQGRMIVVENQIMALLDDPDEEIIAAVIDTLPTEYEAACEDIRCIKRLLAAIVENLKARGL
ncbi:MAG: hypothetical protein EOO65_01840 [Methanosarcinales archaeon]|nr:MAG: hypothetical protein EOO65_01840 [Methanosarcinales archaeon]